MDAQHSCKKRRHNHLQWQWHPTNEQSHRNATSSRATVKVPKSWISPITLEPNWFRLAKAQSGSHIVFIRELALEPFIGHCSKPTG